MLKSYLYNNEEFIEFEDYHKNKQVVYSPYFIL